MVVLGGNFALGCGPGTDYPQIHKFQCILEQTDYTTNEVLEPTMFVLEPRSLYNLFVLEYTEIYVSGGNP